MQFDFPCKKVSYNTHNTSGIELNTKSSHTIPDHNVGNVKELIYSHDSFIHHTEKTQCYQSVLTQRYDFQQISDTSEPYNIDVCLEENARVSPLDIQLRLTTNYGIIYDRNVIEKKDLSKQLHNPSYLYLHWGVSYGTSSEWTLPHTGGLSSEDHHIVSEGNAIQSRFHLRLVTLPVTNETHHSIASLPISQLATPLSKETLLNPTNEYSTKSSQIQQQQQSFQNTSLASCVYLQRLAVDCSYINDSNKQTSLSQAYINEIIIPLGNMTKCPHYFQFVLYDSQKNQWMKRFPNDATRRMFTTFGTLNANWDTPLSKEDNFIFDVKDALRSVSICRFRRSVESMKTPPKMYFPFDLPSTLHANVDVGVWPAATRPIGSSEIVRQLPVSFIIVEVVTNVDLGFTGYDEQVVLHWGVLAQPTPFGKRERLLEFPKTTDWEIPNLCSWPPQTTVAFKGYGRCGAVQTILQSGDVYGKEYLLLKRTRISFPYAQIPLGIFFVLTNTSNTIWLNDKGKNFFIPFSNELRTGIIRHFLVAPTPSVPLFDTDTILSVSNSSLLHEHSDEDNIHDSTNPIIYKNQASSALTHTSISRKLRGNAFAAGAAVALKMAQLGQLSTTGGGVGKIKKQQTYRTQECHMDDLTGESDTFITNYSKTNVNHVSEEEEDNFTPGTSQPWVCFAGKKMLVSKASYRRTYKTTFMNGMPMIIQYGSFHNERGSVVLIVSCKSPTPLLIHWGLANLNPIAGSRWKIPAKRFWPDGTKKVTSCAVETPLKLSSRKDLWTFEVTLPVFVVQHSIKKRQRKKILSSFTDDWNYVWDIFRDKSYSYDSSESSDNMTQFTSLSDNNDEDDETSDLNDLYDYKQEKKLQILWNGHYEVVQLHKMGLSDPEIKKEWAKNSILYGFLNRSQLLHKQLNDKEDFNGLYFVMTDLNHTLWIKEKTKDFYIPMRQLTHGLFTRVVWRGPQQRLVETILTAELLYSNWGTRDRYNLLKTVLQDDAYDKSDIHFWSWIYIWFCFFTPKYKTVYPQKTHPEGLCDFQQTQQPSVLTLFPLRCLYKSMSLHISQHDCQVGPLPYQRGGYFQPWAIAEQTDQLVLLLTSYWKHYPLHRTMIRMILSRVILPAAAVKSNTRPEMIFKKWDLHLQPFFRSWLEKLQTTCTPEDLIICRAIILFLETENIDEFHSMLQFFSINLTTFCDRYPIITDPIYPFYNVPDHPVSHIAEGYFMEWDTLHHRVIGVWNPEMSSSSSQIKTTSTEISKNGLSQNMHCSPSEWTMMAEAGTNKNAISASDIQHYPIDIPYKTTDISCLSEYHEFIDETIQIPQVFKTIQYNTSSNTINSIILDDCPVKTQRLHNTQQPLQHVKHSSSETSENHSHIELSIDNNSQSHNHLFKQPIIKHTQSHTSYPSSFKHIPYETIPVPRLYDAVWVLHFFPFSRKQELLKDFYLFQSFLSCLFESVTIDIAALAARRSLTLDITKLIDSIVTSTDPITIHLFFTISSARYCLLPILLHSADNTILRDVMFLDIALDHLQQELCLQLLVQLQHIPYHPSIPYHVLPSCQMIPTNFIDYNNPILQQDETHIRYLSLLPPGYSSLSLSDRHLSIPSVTRLWEAIVINPLCLLTDVLGCLVGSLLAFHTEYDDIELIYHELCVCLTQRRRLSCCERLWKSPIERSMLHLKDNIREYASVEQTQFSRGFYQTQSHHKTTKNSTINNNSKESHSILISPSKKSMYPFLFPIQQQSPFYLHTQPISQEYVTHQRLQLHHHSYSPNTNDDLSSENTSISSYTTRRLTKMYPLSDSIDHSSSSCHYTTQTPLNNSTLMHSLQHPQTLNELKKKCDIDNELCMQLLLLQSIIYRLDRAVDRMITQLQSSFDEKAQQFSRSRSFESLTDTFKTNISMYNDYPDQLENQLLTDQLQQCWNGDSQLVTQSFLNSPINPIIHLMNSMLTSIHYLLGLPNNNSWILLNQCVRRKTGYLSFESSLLSSPRCYLHPTILIIQSLNVTDPIPENVCGILFLLETKDSPQLNPELVNEDHYCIVSSCRLSPIALHARKRDIFLAGCQDVSVFQLLLSCRTSWNGLEVQLTAHPSRNQITLSVLSVPYDDLNETIHLHSSLKTNHRDDIWSKKNRLNLRFNSYRGQFSILQKHGLFIPIWESMTSLNGCLFYKHRQFLDLKKNLKESTPLHDTFLWLQDLDMISSEGVHPILSGIQRLQTSFEFSHLLAPTISIPFGGLDRALSSPENIKTAERLSLLNNELKKLHPHKQSDMLYLILQECRCLIQQLVPPIEFQVEYQLTKNIAAICRGSNKAAIIKRVGEGGGVLFWFAITTVWASLYTPALILYCLKNGINHSTLRTSVIIQDIRSFDFHFSLYSGLSTAYIRKQLHQIKQTSEQLLSIQPTHSNSTTYDTNQSKASVQSSSKVPTSPSSTLSIQKFYKQHKKKGVPQSVVSLNRHIHSILHHWDIKCHARLEDINHYTCSHHTTPVSASDLLQIQQPTNVIYGELYVGLHIHPWEVLSSGSFGSIGSPFSFIACQSCKICGGTEHFLKKQSSQDQIISPALHICSSDQFLNNTTHLIQTSNNNNTKDMQHADDTKGPVSCRRDTLLSNDVSRSSSFLSHGLLPKRQLSSGTMIHEHLLFSNQAPSLRYVPTSLPDLQHPLLLPHKLLSHCDSLGSYKNHSSRHNRSSGRKVLSFPSGNTFFQCKKSSLLFRGELNIPTDVEELPVGALIVINTGLSNQHVSGNIANTDTPIIQSCAAREQIINRLLELQQTVSEATNNKTWAIEGVMSMRGAISITGCIEHHENDINVDDVNDMDSTNDANFGISQSN